MGILELLGQRISRFFRNLIWHSAPLEERIGLAEDEEEPDERCDRPRDDEVQREPERSRADALMPPTAEKHDAAEARKTFRISRMRGEIKFATRRERDFRIPPEFDATQWRDRAADISLVIDSLGERGNGLTSEIWWTPHHPFKSGLTGQSCQQLTDGYTKATNRPWTQPIGFQHALFEVAIDVLKRAKDPHDPKAVLDSIVATNYQSMVGHIQWTGAPVKNVTKTPLVAGQWKKKGDKAELVIVANRPAPNVPTGGKLELLS